MATDAEARRKFRIYWRKFGRGIVLIRLLVLRAIRREVERRYRGLPLARLEVAAKRRSTD